MEIAPISINNQEFAAIRCKCGAKIWPRSAYDAHVDRFHSGDMALGWCTLCKQPFPSANFAESWCPDCRKNNGRKQRKAAAARRGRVTRGRPKGGAIKREFIPNLKRNKTNVTA